jgi:lambda family phage portal protein
MAAQYTPHFVGATLHKRNFDFVPPHRSGNAAVRESWDLLTRRIRWAIDNTYIVKRAVRMMVQLCVESGINAYFAGLPDVHSREEAAGILAHPLYLFGEESDQQFERWADKFADVSRRQSLYEMQAMSAGELFGSGNSLWLQVLRPAPEGVSPVSYQLLEAEQLDDSRDRPASKGNNRIEHGIEYDRYGEPVAYWLYDAHPYDSYTTVMIGRSNRVPAHRVTHLALTTRASQDFGVSLYNIMLQPSHDEDWLVGHELTSAALAAGLTIVLKEGEDDDGEVPFDTEAAGLSEPAAFDDSKKPGVPDFAEVGLAAGTVARLSSKHGEEIEVVESKRPNKDVEPFAKFLINRASMSSNLSYHRFMGNPTGASFAALRAMINDDRAMSEPVTRALAPKIAGRQREVHDAVQVALGRYRTVTAATYRENLGTYTDYDLLGPPLRLLNPTEDVRAAQMRIRSGLSTLRRECGLMGMNYRRVLRQLAVEGALADALGVVLDFSAGGGQAPDRTTTTQPREPRDVSSEGD